MRVKRGTQVKKSHKNVFKLTKGFRMGRKNLIKRAKEAAMKSGKNAYVGRKQKKRNFRALWIIRLNAALRKEGISYSNFINKLKKANIILNRNILSELAIHEPDTFKAVVNKVK
jgi:large subunit ribosomal protein L20